MFFFYFICVKCAQQLNAFICIYNVYIGDEQPAANPLLRTTFAQNPSSADSTWYQGEKIAPRTTSSGKFALIPDNVEYVGISKEDGEVLNKVYKKTAALMERGD